MSSRCDRTRTCARTHARTKTHTRAGFLSDLHAFDPAALVWTDLSTAGPWPPARAAAGFTAAGPLYLHGGIGMDEDGQRKKKMDGWVDV